MSDHRTNEVDKLIQVAARARENAYARYSKFSVGSAVIGESGRIYPGANVENASYGLTMCAERVAVFCAIAAGEKSITAVAVVTGAEAVTPPCGACRQVINEFGPDALVYCANLTGQLEVWTVSALLPHSFGPEALGFAVTRKERTD